MLADVGQGFLRDPEQRGFDRGPPAGRRCDLTVTP
jgi:hypothetical protein